MLINTFGTVIRYLGQKPRMNAKDEFMDILWKGLAGLAGSFLNTAAKKGLAFMLLILVVGGLVWALFEVDARHGREVAKLEDRVLNLEVKYEICMEEKAKQAGEIAALKTAFELLKGKKR